MLYPYTIPAECVFDREELAQETECICGCKSELKGKLVTWTHKVGSQQYGWFLCHTPSCFIENVSAGSA